MPKYIFVLLVLLSCLVGCQPSQGGTSQDGPNTAGPVALRLAVTLNPQALADFERGVAQLEEDHPEWDITLENIPHEGRVERITTQIASQTLPDVLLVDGLTAQQWIRQGAFADMTPFIEQEEEMALGVFFPDTIAQFAYNDRQWGIPADAAPEVVFYNMDMFDAAGLEYPRDTWSYDDMREAARLLTLDSEGRNATDPDFDPTDIVQWGWNSTPQHLWARHYIQARGGDYCANADCTLIDMKNPLVIKGFQWWAEMAQVDYSAPYAVYSGEQTGVPGDPFVAGKAAMGLNNSAAIGQLNSQSTMRYDIVQPFVGTDGKRYGPLSTQGYVIAATSAQSAAAWALIQELTSEEFLAEYVGTPGHAIPARRTVAATGLDETKPPANQQVLVQVLEYEQVFRPFTASAFEAFGKTNGLFVEAMKGGRPLEEILAEIEQTANEVLAKDRE